MSWQGSCDIPANAAPHEVDAALSAMVIDNGRKLSEETVEAVNGARQCAKQLLYSGAFGALPFAAGAGYRISISGHSNPEHRPTTGWSNECVNVTVYQKPLETADRSQ